MTDAIAIEVWSDIACPWCYIGKRNLERGIASRGADAPEVRVTYRSFELAPDTPVDFEGGEADYLAAHKGVDAATAQQMLERVTGVAADAGLEYRFDLLHHTNTVKAHQLLHYAKERGRQHEMSERLMAAYFTEGRHLGRDDELVSLAVEIGFDADDVRAALEQETHLESVRADQAQAAAYGISGVPFFVIDGAYGVSGAQPPEAFSQILDQVWRERVDDEPAEPEPRSA
ncbi:DsbA family oxidoreductase [Microbacterium sp. SSW1-59]|uniref:DsbA family oxidoreductase n=1 Tax=Microbacterium xanthum TaxID=3079794 RepID=UPI002AD495B1|nr:DsbA family oxidoreductase [Microbacterium sp. SSW1-59]MDZ8202328.1 DsbA family oxidoreductase [Microbacterium sp. SSW1-59]